MENSRLSSLPGGVLHHEVKIVLHTTPGHALFQRDLIFRNAPEDGDDLQRSGVGF